MQSEREGANSKEEGEGIGEAIFESGCANTLCMQVVFIYSITGLVSLDCKSGKR